MTHTPTYKVSEVVRMRREGLTYRQIGEHFRISSSRVGHIIKAADKHDREAVRADTLRLELRASGGLTKKVPLADVLCLLDLSGRGKDQLQKWCNSESISGLSLLDLMDMLLPIVEHPKGYYDLMPAYKVRGLGIIIRTSFVTNYLFSAGMETLDSQPSEGQKIVPDALLESLPGRYRKAADEAIALFRFFEKKDDVSYAPVFTALLGLWMKPPTH